MQKIIKKIILWILLLILALNIFGCSDSEENIDLSQIVVNTRKDSHKIHRISCAYVDKMAEHNKWYPNKAIDELISEGYVPCDICLAKTYKKYIEGKYDRKNIENKETTIVTQAIVEVKETKEDLFIKSIEDVASWYINNVYTYQGAHKVKKQIEKMAKDASPEAYKIWTSIKNNFNDEEFVMTSTNDDINTNGEYLNNDAKYKSDKINDITIKNGEVVDDCSKFATAVYYYYYSLIKEKNIAEKMDLIYTGSFYYSRVNNKIISLLKKNNMFAFYDWEAIKEIDIKYGKGEEKEPFTLKAGDLIYRKEKRDKNNRLLKSGHVEFYLGNNKVFGWGSVKLNYNISKNFIKGKDGFYSDAKSDQYNGSPQPYVAVVRFVGGKE